MHFNQHIQRDTAVCFDVFPAPLVYKLGEFCAM